MSLIYGLVAKGSTILAEHMNSSGNFATGQRKKKKAHKKGLGISTFCYCPLYIKVIIY